MKTVWASYVNTPKYGVRGIDLHASEVDALEHVRDYITTERGIKSSAVVMNPDKFAALDRDEQYERLERLADRFDDEFLIVERPVPTEAQS